MISKQTIKITQSNHILQPKKKINSLKFIERAQSFR